jgi:hypothetical protein
MPELVAPPVQPLKERCNHCGQRIQLQRKEVLGKGKIRMLKAAAAHVMTTMQNDFMVRDISAPEEYKLYSNFHHLRFHGIVAKVKKDGKVVPRHWLVTRNGWAWLRGEIALPKYVMVKDNAIQSRSDQLIYLKDRLGGEDYIQTSFEYFDDDGNPVGIRPHYPAPENNQARLI